MGYDYGLSDRFRYGGGIYFDLKDKNIHPGIPAWHIAYAMFSTDIEDRIFTYIIDNALYWDTLPHNENLAVDLGFLIRVGNLNVMTANFMFYLNVDGQISNTGLHLIFATNIGLADPLNHEFKFAIAHETKFSKNFFLGI